MFSMQVMLLIRSGRNETSCDGAWHIDEGVAAWELDGYGDYELDSAGNPTFVSPQSQEHMHWAAQAGVPEVDPEAFEAVYQWFLS